MFECDKLKRQKAIKRIRAKFGRVAKYEILIFKSCKYIYAQLIEISSKKAIFSASSLALSNEVKSKKFKLCVETGNLVGKELAKKCLENKKNKIEKVAFNKASYKFHGIVKAVCDGFDEVFRKN